MPTESINADGESTDDETRHEDEFVRDSGAGDPDKQPPPSRRSNLVPEGDS